MVGFLLENTLKTKDKSKALTLTNKKSVIDLANKIHELLVEHGNLNEATCALHVANELWKSIQYKSADQRGLDAWGLDMANLSTLVKT